MLLNKDELQFKNSDSAVPKSRVFHTESYDQQSLVPTSYGNNEDHANSQKILTKWKRKFYYKM